MHPPAERRVSFTEGKRNDLVDSMPFSIALGTLTHYLDRARPHDSPHFSGRPLVRSASHHHRHHDHDKVTGRPPTNREQRLGMTSSCYTKNNHAPTTGTGTGTQLHAPRPQKKFYWVGVDPLWRLASLCDDAACTSASGGLLERQWYPPRGRRHIFYVFLQNVRGRLND